VISIIFVDITMMAKSLSIKAFVIAEPWLFVISIFSVTKLAEVFSIMRSFRMSTNVHLFDLFGF